MSVQMSTSAAKALIAKLHEEGLTYEEIAKRLRDKGYTQRGKGGKPIDAAGVGYHVRNLKTPKTHVMLAPAPKTERYEAGPTHPGTVYPPANDKIRLALEILKSGLSAEAKEAAAAAILNS